MIRSAFLLCALAAATIAAATVTPLPGSTPQSAVAGSTFAPIRVLVTDAAGKPAPGVQVQWRAPERWPSIDLFCSQELGFPCSATTDAQGVASLDTLRPAIAGNFAVTITTTQPDDRDFGTARLDLSVAPRAYSQLVIPISGDYQRAVIGTEYAERFVVVTLTPEARPQPFTTVTFRAPRDGTPSGRFHRDGLPQFDAVVVSDANGIAVSPPFTAGTGVGASLMIAETFDANALIYVRAPFSITNTNPDGSAFSSFQDMWWSGPQESGWGMSLAQHGENLFGVVFAYDARGAPTWWVLPSGRWDSGLGSAWFTPAYSPLGTPFYAYDAGRFAAGNTPGGATLLFDGPDEGSLHLFFDGAITHKAIVRQHFAKPAAAPLQGLSDMWWGGIEQNGWGVSIMQEGGGLFAVWFTYDAAGLPTWFVMPDGDWDGTTYAGPMYRTHGPAWAGVSFDSSQVSIAARGTYRLRFADTGHATLEYSIDGHAGSLALVRQGF